jgi:kinesin family protein 5
LAGSEKTSKSGAEGKTLQEANKINTSLTSLGKVIKALSNSRCQHVPYRDSKLTRILRESLGGNSQTALIVTCSPHIDNLQETLSTMRFGVSTRKIRNRPIINRQLTLNELQLLLDKTQT